MIIFASFETEFSSHGGLGAVMKLLPKEIGVDQCAVLSPFFKQLIPLDKLLRDQAITSYTSRFTFHLLIRGTSYPVEVIEAVNRNGLRLFFLSSDEFFRAPHNPYVNPCNPTLPLDPYRNPNNGEKLAEDALFFSIAAPVALVELSKAGLIQARDLVLHLQDWETAAIAQAVKRTHTYPALDSIRCVLTIHNPYDKPLHELNAPRVCDFAAHLGFVPHHSILEQVIPLLDAPVSTVSAGFAHELRNEVLYTQVFCPHLQAAFKEKGLIGIDNGIFGTPTFPFSDAALTDAKAGRFTKLAAEKKANRVQLESVMRTYQSELAARSDVTVWGGPLDLADPSVPVFFILGRDDPRQKGFDVMAEAIRNLPHGVGRYIFAVMPGDEGLLGIAFLRRLADERPREVCILPIRIAKNVFDALRLGSSFLVMGSMYEPFGAANEGYLSGMPVVARATGGLVQQVTPHPTCMQNEALLSLYGRQLVRRYHSSADGATGILFREHVSFSDEAEGWRELVDCSYWEQNPKGDRVDERRHILLFQEMVHSAVAALKLAMSVYQDPALYAAMIFNGWNMLDQFRWSRSIDTYRKFLYRHSTKE